MVFTGIATELGVESSARNTLNRDFYSIIVSDSIYSSDKDIHTPALCRTWRNSFMLYL